MASLGTAAICIRVNSETTAASAPVILPTQVDIVDSNAHILMSHESMRKMKGSIDFE